MIYYNSNIINDWNFGDDNIIKVYKHGAVVFYKFDSEQGGYKVCYAVVDDITQYSDTEFEDVYDKATEKWFKLNNLNQYEEYGIYGSGRTSCEDSTSRLPVGYTEVEYIENTGTSYLNTNFVPNQDTRVVCDMQMVTASNYPRLWGAGAWNSATGLMIDYDPNQFQVSWLGKTSWTNYSAYPTSTSYNRHTYDLNKNYMYIDEALVGSNTYTTRTASDPIGVFTYIGSGRPSSSSYWGQEHFKGKMYSFKVYDNGTLVRDLVPCIKDSDNTVGAYDIVNDVFYTVPTGYTTDKLIAGDPVTPTDCVTTYNGKLTIDNGYEYEWNGSSWVNLGEISGSSKTSDFKIGDIDTPITSDASLITDGMYGVMLPVSLSANTSSAVALMGSSDTNTLSNLSSHTKTEVISENDIIDYAVWKFHGTATANTFYVENVATKKYFGYSDVSSSSYMPLVDESSKVPTVFSAFTYYNVTALGICKGNAPNQYYAINDLYGSHNQYNWYNPLSSAVDLNNSYVIYELKGIGAVYPKYYSEKSEPLDNLAFNTLAEAQAYAEANCVYDGMHATIDGDKYYFDSTDENGWVKVTEYYVVEDVTPSGGSGWTISGSDTYNPDSSYYDDFDLETTSTSNATKIAKVTIYGYDHFTYYLRSYHPYTSYGYVIATNVDEIQTPPTSISYNAYYAITNTYYWNKSPKSTVNLSNYRRVTYNNLDKTVEHTFYVYFYGRTYSSYVGNATILIPKEQTNENWEQVTFSASSNVASTYKNLYIDGNNSTSGGTQFWYYRWMIGLPSGSHSSYTNYSSYDYCPNVTSSTFTSVAGEQRQINFTYDGTSDKTLSFRLTDGSNVLTPSDTVYYNINYYNNCGISIPSTNVTFPRTLNVKVGGRLNFYSSSDRHYIYGYSPNIPLYQDYYVDNYQDTFDITYTKLSDEAVTITYTTYDPSDVETPAFKTDITWPYSGGTTSSTTLTSFDVPYTYPYKVSQTSDKFSADAQSYTANQAARTINFVLYPNNREFATVADLEAYQYAWEGMKAKVGDTKYQYKNGEWVENQHSLPDVPFTVNYNARQYNVSTKTLLKTEGQLANVDAVITAGTPTVHGGYLTIESGTRATISGYQNYFNRDNNNPSLTIISKQRTDGDNCHMFANRDSDYNWMYRCYSNMLTLHGMGEQGSVSVTTQPVIESVRVNSNRLLTYNNYTDNTSSTSAWFNYGSTNSGDFALFAGYASYSGEWFVGDFYWVYMCQGTLTDEQVQQVIDYNENL